MLIHWITFGYNLFLAVFVMLALRRLRQTPYPAVHVIVSAVVLGALAFMASIPLPLSGFGRLRLLTWAVFFQTPAFLLAAAYLLWARRRAFACAAIALVAVLLLIAGDAFLVEPQQLQVSRYTVHSARLGAPLRIAILTDIQTDAPGAYEEQALQRAQAEAPDLILFGGDYVQQAMPADYTRDVNGLNAILRRVNLHAPLGVYAIGGNVEWRGRLADIFADTPARLFETSESLDLGPLVLTGLTFDDSANTALAVGRQEKYHIVLGHTPNFSRGAVQADLLIAGHTHGGQVRLPVVGALTILAEVPRAWGAGLTEIAPGKWLLVSRGVGMERDQAPRLRFLCRPEIVILDLLPAE